MDHLDDSNVSRLKRAIVRFRLMFVFALLFSFLA